MRVPAGGAELSEDRPPGPSAPSVQRRSSWRERLGRRPLGPGLWAGLILLAGYFAVALSAVVVFWNSLDQLSTNLYWIPPPPWFRATLGPSAAHPLGVLPGIGTDIFRAVWQATPWDLSIVAAILAFDAVFGWLLGALAGMEEGGLADTAVRFVGDSLGAIPSFFLVVALFAGLTAVAPGRANLTVFVVLFGVIIWPTTARTTRERARVVSREPFLESAKASGGGRRYVFFRHILPNSAAPLLAQIPVDVAPIFFVLTIFPWFWDCAGGVYNHIGGMSLYPVPSLPTYSPLPSLNFPEWGNLLAVGACYGLPISTVGPVYWWMFVPPLVAILGLGIAIALVCDGLEKRLARRPR